MNCPRCRAENREDRRFCSECGAALLVTCPVCGFVNAAVERFCGGCGVAVVVPAVAPGPAAPALETERKHVTVLFADIRGSLELLAHRDPEDANAVLEPVLEALIKAVHTYGGTVNQVLGDGIMALFGAPLAYEDHGLRACSAALAMQDAVRELSRRLENARDTPVQLRVGLNSGEVVVRATISDVQRDYSAVGETTHVASRVEQLTEPGTVTLTGETLKLVAGRVDVAPLGAVAVKGLAQSVDLYRLIAIRALRTRIRGPLDRQLSRFVGRGLELGVLAQALEQVRQGHGQLVTVVGEPGVGKTRLFLEFTRSPVVEGCLVLESGSEAFGPTSALAPVVELARSYLQAEPGEGTESLRAKLRQRLDGGDDTAEAAFLSLLSAQPDGNATAAGGAAERQYRMLTGITRALVRESRRQPLVVVVEDLHWIDASSRAFIDMLLEELRTTAIAVLVSYRPDYQPGWGHRSYRQIRLERFSRGEVDTFLDALMGTDPSLEAIKADLERQTDGNALFLEESVRALVESGVIVGDTGRYRLGTRPLDVQVPASVQAVLAARIDRLPAEDKRVLQCAAVIGRSVPHNLLEATAETKGEALDRVTARLRAGEFLYESRRYPVREYVFKHALTHEVTYGTLLHERRRRLHGAIFDALGAEAGADRLDAAAQRAYHAFRAEMWDQALAYLRRAAGGAVARSADAEAVQYLDNAVTALSHLPETPEMLAQAVDVRLELRNALMPLGDRARIFRALVEGEAIARRLGDRRRLGWVCGYLTPYLWGLGQYDRAREAGGQALEIAGELGDVALGVIANRYLGHVSYAVGDYREAVRLLGTSLSSLKDDVLHQHFGLPYLSSIATGSWLASSLAELGRFDEAIERAASGVRAAEAAGHAYSIAAASCGLALASLRKGELERAIAVAERALELCRSNDFSAIIAWVTAMLGSAYAQAGKLPEALFLLQEGVDRMATMQVRVSEASVVAALGEASLLAGRHDAALREAERALEIARSRQEGGYEAWALRLLGEVHARAGAFPRAEDCLRAASAIAQARGMRPLLGHCHLGLALVHRGRRDRTVAADELGKAAALFRALGMDHWLAVADKRQREEPSADI